MLNDQFILATIGWLVQLNYIKCIDCAICYHTFVYMFAFNIYIKNSAYYKACLFCALLLSAIMLIFKKGFLD